jgi:hypothetical protein
MLLPRVARSSPQAVVDEPCVLVARTGQPDVRDGLRSSRAGW